MTKILAPHKEQDGWVYHRTTKKPRVAPCPVCGARLDLNYDDTYPTSRVISSARVEEAVETADYLRRCADEGLVALAVPGEGWGVTHPRMSIGINGAPNHLDMPFAEEGNAGGATLREAYHRYHNEVAR